jgi:hypothetical protein
LPGERPSRQPAFLYRYVGAGFNEVVKMNYNEHRYNGVAVLEIDDSDVAINSAQDLLDIISDFSTKKIILRKENLNEDFFDLKTGFAGEILQKASNYKICIGVIGDFENVESKSLRDFIYESNRTKQIVFKKTVPEVLKIFCR